MVQFLVERGAVLEAKDNHGYTPLIQSVKEGKLSVVRFLVERAAALEATDDLDWTPLVWGAWGENLDVVRFLVESGNAVEATDDNGFTPLIQSARKGNMDAVRFLVQRGAALEAADKAGKMSLFESALFGKLDVVRCLVDHGANASALTEDGDTPLHYLLSCNDKEDILLPIVRKMLANGALHVHRKKRGESARDVALTKGLYRVVRLLYKKIKSENSPAYEVNTVGTPSFGSSNSAQILDGEDHPLNSGGSSIGDEHNSPHVDGNVVINAANSSVSYTHLDDGTTQVQSAVTSPLSVHFTREDENSNADSLMEMLSYVAERCKSAKESASLYQDVLSRLQTLALGVVATGSEDKYLAATQTKIRSISTRLKLLLDANVDKPIVLRLVSVRAVVDTLSSFHTELDRLESICSGQKRRNRSGQWEEDVASVRQLIFARTESSLPTLVNELSSDKLQIEAMTLLICELSRNKRYYSARERDLMQLVHSRIVGFSKLQVMDVEGWFIPQYEVTIDTYDSVGSGAFGVVYRGVWRKSEIVVKSLNVKSEADKRAFFREVAVWHRIRHRNIVRFLGACHLSSPYFIMCEYAPGGSLLEYLYRPRQNGKVFVWRKLHEVSLGLYYLHAEGIVHGDLKKDNILVANDGTAMLTDFGLSFVQSATVATLDKWGAIRWRAPEYVVQGGAGPSFAADVYSLAMVIVEAVTGQTPWGLLPDVAVTVHLRNKEMLKRPINCAEMTDEAWDLVSRMSVYEPSERMALSKVVDRLKEFAEDEEDQEWKRTRVKSEDSY